MCLRAIPYPCIWHILPYPRCPPDDKKSPAQKDLPVDASRTGEANATMLKQRPR